MPAQASLPVMIEEDEPDNTATFTKATQYVLTEGMESYATASTEKKKKK